MNKKILGIFVSLLVVALLATPVLANPTNGQKTAVRLTLKQTARVDNPPKLTGNSVHLTSIQTFQANITFADDSKIVGTLVANRKIVNRAQKDGAKITLTDYYEFEFPTEGGGFVGNAQVLLDGMPPTTGGASSLAYGLFHGTGDFEGQTLNVGHGWEAFGGTVKPWTGYWLKCSVYA